MVKFQTFLKSRWLPAGSLKRWIMKKRLYISAQKLIRGGTMRRDKIYKRAEEAFDNHTKGNVQKGSIEDLFKDLEG